MAQVLYVLYWGQETVSRLLDDCDTQLANSMARVNETDSNGNTALIWASQEGNSNIVERLLNRGADGNHEANGRTALMAASEKGDLKCVEALLQWGAEPNLLTVIDLTALMLACDGGHNECMEALLRRGAKVDDKNTCDRTALHYAALGGKEDCLRTLLKWGANPDIQGTCERKTALMMASIREHVGCVKALLQFGADVKIQDKNGSTAILHASGNVVRTLLQNALSAAQKTAAQFEVLQTGGEPVSAACSGRLRSAAFRQDGENKFSYEPESTKGLEVDHIIGLEMVSEAFCGVFKHQTLQTCLKVMCEILPILNGKYNLCRVSGSLNKAKAKKYPDDNELAVTLKYMKAVKEVKLMHHVISDILNIFEHQPCLQSLIERFAKVLVGLLKGKYPSLQLDLDVMVLKDINIQTTNNQHLEETISGGNCDIKNDTETQ